MIDAETEDKERVKEVRCLTSNLDPRELPRDFSKLKPEHFEPPQPVYAEPPYFYRPSAERLFAGQ